MKAKLIYEAFERKSAEQNRDIMLNPYLNKINNLLDLLRALLKDIGIPGWKIEEIAQETTTHQKVENAFTIIDKETWDNKIILPSRLTDYWIFPSSFTNEYIDIQKVEDKFNPDFLHSFMIKFKDVYFEGRSDFWIIIEAKNVILMILYNYRLPISQDCYVVIDKKGNHISTYKI